MDRLSTKFALASVSFQFIYDGLILSAIRISINNY